MWAGGSVVLQIPLFFVTSGRTNFLSFKFFKVKKIVRPVALNEIDDVVGKKKFFGLLTFTDGFLSATPVLIVIACSGSLFLPLFFNEQIS